MSAWVISALGPSSRMNDEGASAWTKPETLTKPLEWIPFPNIIVFRPHEATKTFGVAQSNPFGVSDMYRLGFTLRGCDVFLVRSCWELEAEYLELLERLHGKPVVPVGLLPVSKEEGQGANEDTWRSIIGWLDKHGNGSVVYITLGSEVAPSQEQIIELVLGMELSGKPFFWAFKKPAGS